MDNSNVAETFVFVLQACDATKAMPDTAPTRGGADITIVGNNFGIMNDMPQVQFRACSPCRSPDLRQIFSAGVDWGQAVPADHVAEQPQDALPCACRYWP